MTLSFNERLCFNHVVSEIDSLLSLSPKARLSANEFILRFL